MELDDQLGEAHNSMAAMHLFLGWDFQQADRESARAIELIPNNSENHHLRAYVLEVLIAKAKPCKSRRKLPNWIFFFVRGRWEEC